MLLTFQHFYINKLWTIHLVLFTSIYSSAIIPPKLRLRDKMTPHVLDSSKKNTNCFTILSSDAQPKASGRTTSPTNLSSTDQANLRMSAQVYEDHKFVVVAERFQTIENTVSEMKTMLETPKKKNGTRIAHYHYWWNSYSFATKSWQTDSEPTSQRTISLDWKFCIIFIQWTLRNTKVPLVYNFHKEIFYEVLLLTWYKLYGITYVNVPMNRRFSFHIFCKKWMIIISPSGTLWTTK